MQPLNAIDAVAPAFTRTHQTLFHPFRAGRSWKLAATSYLGFCGSMFVPLPLFFLLVPRDAFPGFEQFRPALLTATAIFTLIILVILYFCAGMELVMFEMVVTRAKFIAPMWRHYSRRVWPWIGLKVLIGTIYTALIMAIFFAPIKHLVEGVIAAFPSLSSFPHGPDTDPTAVQAAVQAAVAPFISQMINLEIIGVGIAFLLKIPSTLLNDFVLPFYVLEDLKLLAAIRRGFGVFVADPIQSTLYLILKPILFVIGYIMQYIALSVAMIPVIIVVAIIVAIGAVIFAFLGSHSGAGGLLLGAAITVLYAAFGGLFFYLTIGSVGYLLTLLEAYGIYFLGGRYPLLGSLLEGGPDKPFTPPPVFPSEEERKDRDGGPPMPMDPAVA